MEHSLHKLLVIVALAALVAAPAVARTHATAEDADDAVPLAEPIQAFNGLIVRQTIRFGGNVVGEVDLRSAGLSNSASAGQRLRRPRTTSCATSLANTTSRSLKPGDFSNFTATNVQGWRKPCRLKQDNPSVGPLVANSTCLPPRGFFLPAVIGLESATRLPAIASPRVPPSAQPHDLAPRP
jgi:hypothetical protein